LFTTAAIDNIDHNPTSNTAGQSFHGTDISMFQNRTSQSDGTKHEQQPEGTSESSRKYSLPDYYTNVTPASLVTNNQSFSLLMFFLQRMILFTATEKSLEMLSVSSRCESPAVHWTLSRLWK